MQQQSREVLFSHDMENNMPTRQPSVQASQVKSGVHVRCSCWLWMNPDGGRGHAAGRQMAVRENKAIFTWWVKGK